jgi:hypothetical protein
VISRRSPDVIFLLETHLDLFPAEMLRRQLKMDFKEVVCSDGRSGGLILFWKRIVTLTVRDRTENFIDVIIGSGQENAWRFTWMYGEPRWENKHLTWQRLRKLNQFGDSPWLVMGDLNDILYPFEKEGGKPRPNRCMKAFRDCLEDCHLIDVGYTGDKFTWCRGQIRERLDRALANEAWCSKFPDASLVHLDYYRSDHRPILLSMDEENMPDEKGPAILRFEARWLKEKNFMEIVEGAWVSTGPLGQNSSLVGRLAQIHEKLHKWDKYVLRRNKNVLRQTQRKLEAIVREDLTADNIARQKELSQEIENLLELEEMHWAQRSRINWLQYGDKNTSYFHNFASMRREKNRIKKLKDDNGNWLEGSIYLNPHISGYFAGLFSTEVDDPDPELINKVTPRVTREMNESLLRDYTAEDVKKALFSIGDTKAPGTDGLHAIFFKKCWHIIGDTLTSEDK